MECYARIYVGVWGGVVEGVGWVAPVEGEGGGGCGVGAGGRLVFVIGGTD